MLLDRIRSSQMLLGWSRGRFRSWSPRVVHVKRLSRCHGDVWWSNTRGSPCYSVWSRHRSDAVVAVDRVAVPAWRCDGWSVQPHLTIPCSNPVRVIINTLKLFEPDITDWVKDDMQRFFLPNWLKVVSSCLLQYKPVYVTNFAKLRRKMLKKRTSLLVFLL